MKKVTQLLASATMAFIVIGVADANPQSRGRGGFIVKHKSATVETIQKLKKGDKCAIVCTICKTMEIKVIQSPEEVAALCHDGGEIECTSCKEKRVIKRTGPRKNIITYRTEKGEECMYVFPLKEKAPKGE